MGLFIENQCNTSISGKNSQDISYRTNYETTRNRQNLQKKSKDFDDNIESEGDYGDTSIVDNIRPLSTTNDSGSRTILQQIQCPPTVNKKTISKFMTRWAPALKKYGMDYTGLNQAFGLKTNKKKLKRTAIGNNRFIKSNGKCGVASEYGCRGEDKYLYLKTYPLGYIPNCDSKNKSKIIGGTGLIGNIQEDIYNLDADDVTKSFFNRGPLASNVCMKARLPVGDSLMRSNKRRENKEDAELNNGGWWVEEHCVPKQSTIEQKYGGEIFDIPYSNCKEDFSLDNNLKSKQTLIAPYRSNFEYKNSKNNNPLKSRDKIIIVTFLLLLLAIIILYQ